MLVIYDTVVDTVVYRTFAVACSGNTTCIYVLGCSRNNDLDISVVDIVRYYYKICVACRSIADDSSKIIGCSGNCVEF